MLGLEKDVILVFAYQGVSLELAAGLRQKLFFKAFKQGLLHEISLGV